MTLDEYRRNLRGVNGGEDFDPEYLVRLPSRFLGAFFDHIWLLRKQSMILYVNGKLFYRTSILVKLVLNMLGKSFWRETRIQVRNHFLPYRPLLNVDFRLFCPMQHINI